MKRAVTLLLVVGCGVLLSAFDSQRRVAAQNETETESAVDRSIEIQARQFLAHGRQIFRFDTFGDEAFWGDALKLHQAIEGAKLGGVGPGVSPATALAVGLKVDVDALPASLIAALRTGNFNLNDPATTLALLKLNSVVGVTGFFNDQGTLRSVGIQCAFCHSTVDNSFAPGIGHRLDGWANRDLNVGAIVSLAPDLTPFTDLLGVDSNTLKTVLATWGPGCYDAELNKDGKASWVQACSCTTRSNRASRVGQAAVDLHSTASLGAIARFLHC
jgi:hypothetical protein